MLCIDIGYTRHCVGSSFLFFYHPKKVKKRILVVTKEHAKFQKNLSSVNFVDISYHSFITQHIKTTYITETVKVRQAASIRII